MKNLIYLCLSILYFFISLIYIFYSVFFQLEIKTLYINFQIYLVLFSIFFEDRVIYLGGEKWIGKGAFKSRLDLRYYIGFISLIPIFGPFIHSFFMVYKSYKIFLKLNDGKFTFYKQ